MAAQNNVRKLTEFNYGGKTFFPVGMADGSYNYIMQHVRSVFPPKRNDPFTAYGGGTWSRRGFLDAAGKINGIYDLYRDVETGKIYIPSGNELYEYTGKIFWAYSRK